MKRPFSISQNFLHSPRYIERLLDKTNINFTDTVYDIGAGKGIIARALAQRCKAVIAIEIDSALVLKLKQNLAHLNNVEIVQADFLKLALPKVRYKVFANIPFNLSSEIVHKLLDSENPPRTSYLIVQKEFAEKIIPQPGGYTSQLAILLADKFTIKVLHNIPKRTFYPQPKVDTVLVEIQKRQAPLVPRTDQQLFRDLVVYAYNAPRSGGKFPQLPALPSQTTVEEWLEIFNTLTKNRPALVKAVDGYERVDAKIHRNRTKVHRTRR